MIDEVLNEADTKNNIKIVNGVDVNKLQSYVDRVINIMNDIKSLQEDLKELKIEIKDNKLDVKGVMTMVKILGRNQDKQAEEDFIIETYREVLNI